MNFDRLAPLLPGDGNDRRWREIATLPECVRFIPKARIVVMDASARMLEIAANKMASKRVEFVLADLLV